MLKRLPLWTIWFSIKWFIILAFLKVYSVHLKFIAKKYSFFSAISCVPIEKAKNCHLPRSNHFHLNKQTNEAPKVYLTMVLYNEMIDKHIPTSGTSESQTMKLILQHWALPNAVDFNRILNFHLNYSNSCESCDTFMKLTI